MESNGTTLYIDYSFMMLRESEFRGLRSWNGLMGLEIMIEGGLGPVVWRLFGLFLSWGSFYNIEE